MMEILTHQEVVNANPTFVTIAPSGYISHIPLSTLNLGKASRGSAPGANVFLLFYVHTDRESLSSLSLASY